MGGVFKVVGFGIYIRKKFLLVKRKWVVWKCIELLLEFGK